MTYPPGDWLPLAADASARRYFKGRYEGREALLADFGGDADGLDRFVSVRQLLGDHDLPVPEIYGVDRGGSWLVQEFVSGRPLSRTRWAEDLPGKLVDLADKVAAIASWPEGPELLSLDEARLRFELSFFRIHFLEGFLNLPAPEGLGEALDRLAEGVAAYPTVLAHRDFHSENILEGADGRLVIVDFQDALLAPRAYDAASLAVDPYRPQGDRLSRRFRDRWLEKNAGGTALEFEQTALQRALKALGTFGYQVTRRKKARYMRFILPQAKRALELLPAGPLGIACLEPLLGSVNI